MRLGCLVAIIALAALNAQGAMWKGFRAPAKSVVEHEKGFLWLEAEEFSDYGTWVIDTQFVGKMGSAYLLGAGVTGCCANATTKLSVPRNGKWRAWVRTRDWIPEYHPGRFAVDKMWGQTLREFFISIRLQSWI